MPSFLPTMPMPISMPSPQPPPPPPAVPAQLPPPPLEPKLSLKELKAKLLANRKMKERALAADTPEVSDLDTPTLSHLTTTTSVPPPLALSDMQESLEPSSKPPSPPAMVTSTSTQSIASRTESPSPQMSAAAPVVIPANSRRPGAADFVDVPPSRLASSTFFRSNVRRTFAPPQPKRLVVDLGDTSDDSDSDEESNPDRDLSPSVEPEPDHATALRLMHEAELRIALERKKAQLLENRAKIAAYAAQKKAAALLSAKTDTATTPSPNMIPTGLALAVPSVTEKMSVPVSPTISRASVVSPETQKAVAATLTETNNTGGAAICRISSHSN